jgi:hypothetical protein
MSLRCWFGWHGYLFRDRTLDGRQVLRCARCWRVRNYLPINVETLQAWRDAQREQAHRLAVKATWRAKVE